MLVIWALSCFGLVFSQEEDTLKIRAAFKQWQQTQIEHKHFVSKDNCHYSYIAAHEPPETILGFPDSINFYYAHLNNDQHPDALITFRPLQCEGGNASVNTQYKLLALSTPSGYTIDDTFFNLVDIMEASGFYILDSLNRYGFYGTYYNYTETDGYCCPSIKKTIKITFPSLQVFID